MNRSNLARRRSSPFPVHAIVYSPGEWFLPECQTEVNDDDRLWRGSQDLI